ncbi:enoyl-[acyl-carrier-protein] reductase FabK [Gehongia tenuis]|uniref:Probable nitronate monooxygenase n=1 Tax=Gehongia tenuis TaxID=2763655 RepID=A0A926D358_9FIRM|nr:enoyl-[acyl-carrier-protein] reductase FabK [Gehongia tenuis]MBC8530381.1 enoyl-[acyl-carrier-protein] reductase FabK [Gehongia tenuis]
MNTRVTELLGIEVPIFQGGMAWVADGDLASAVSAAGGLGIIAAANAPVEWVRGEIAKVRSRTANPFAVNIMLMSPNAEEVAKLVIEEKVPVVTTGAGSPAKYMEDWKRAGIKVIPVIPAVALARRMERCGADAVVAEGCESGGHVGEMTTMALMPQVVDAVKIPVIAAGGIGDGRGMAAAFMLGAGGVQVGTRFVVAKESNVHPAYKERILKARDTDTIVTGRPNGAPVRTLKNKLARELKELEDARVPFEEFENKAAGGLRRAVVEGDVDEGSLMAGQIAGLVSREETCREIIESMVREAEALLGGGGRG